uniref:Uncharacterized protein n=1 Tax=Rhabditophanes sp. KR3021 TaxID=114890 RepID=A0AC35TQW4_9BILA
MDSLNTDGGATSISNKQTHNIMSSSSNNTHQQQANSTNNPTPFPNAASFNRNPQVLIDPNTGQQYIFPSQQPQLYYQPIYIPASANHHGQPAQLYYSGPPQQNNHHQPFLIAAPSGGNYLVQQSPTQNIQQTIQQNGAATDDFNRDNYSRISNSSINSLKDHSDGRGSPRGTVLTTTFAQMRLNKGMTNTTNTSLERVPQSNEEAQQLSRPKLNWNINSTRREGLEADLKSPTSPTKYRRHPFRADQYQPTKLDSPSSPPSEKKKDVFARQVAPQKVTSPVQPVPKSIRLDFDFNAIEPLAKEPAKTPVCRVPPTAFTIIFDEDEEGSPHKKRPKNFEEARLAKLNAKRNKNFAEMTARKEAAANGQDPKRFLLGKLLQGNSNNTKLPLNIVSNSRKQKADTDTLSDAGTYVVNEDNEMVMSRVLDSDEEDSMVHSDSDDGRNSPISNLKKNNRKGSSGSGDSFYSDKTVEDGKKKQPSSPVSSRFASSSNSGSSKVASARSNVVSNNVMTTSVSKAPPKSMNLPSVTVKQTVASKARQAMNDQSLGTKNGPELSRSTARNTVTPTTSTTTSSFRPKRFHSETRADGGRFSMRGQQPAPTPVVTAQIRPPFRTGISTAKPITAASPRDSTEYAAWLRRKDYNPMKAAAEAKKMEKLKQRTDNYSSNRSISFHHGTATKDNVPPQPMSSRFSSSNTKLKKSNSHDMEDSMQTSMDSIHEDDILSSHNFDNSQYNSQSSLNLTKTVDELTSKCQKSIQLIKLCSGHNLSESVENLLEQVVETSNKHDHGDLGVRLENLNAAFDAVQKYLEEHHKERLNSPQVARKNFVTSSINERSRSAEREKVGRSRESSEDSEKITF